MLDQKFQNAAQRGKKISRFFYLGWLNFCLAPRFFACPLLFLTCKQQQQQLNNKEKTAII
ncbi:hypothetical protein HX13_22475 [Chryseobacterium sp. P1-3]|uniref:Uncharacterized protein n=1 Tax=Chryseobacterium gallinarum TaxID=1324352 RepID=A0A0G3M513_CHRGL|nr:hypothetical protein OK18_11090 [Chryseobacterium gallinarum]KFF73175.1 hypothetical protein HX13_22475 [Chryseobacterium sp. P1-3]